MPISSRTDSWRRTVARTAAILAVMACGGTPSAGPLQPPADLFDAGDYHVRRDRSMAPLLRSAGEIAIKRVKSLEQDAVVRATGAESVLTSMGACGEATAHQFEIYSVADWAQARRRLSALEGVVWVSPVLAAPGSGQRVVPSDEIIVQFDDDSATNGAAEAILKELASRAFEVVEAPRPVAPRQYVLRSSRPDPETALAEANALAYQEGVAWAEPNFLVELAMYSTPNDEFFARQQYLHNDGQNEAPEDADVDAPEAWDTRTGNERLVIAIIDTGVDTEHPDLNIFRNDAEYGDGRDSDGVDNDGNGYVDDWRGWDFFGSDDNPNPGTNAAAAHGTACAGVAAAIGNNDERGVAGIAYRSRILPIKIQDDNAGSFTSSLAIANAIRYAAQHR